VSESKIQGVVHEIEETKTFGQKGFRKRLFVLEQEEGSFTNYIPICLTGEDCHKADNLHRGDQVEVEFRLSGRKWQRDSNSEVKYFLEATAVDITVLQMNETEPPVGTDVTSESEGDGDIPF